MLTVGENPNYCEQTGLDFHAAASYFRPFRSKSRNPHSPHGRAVTQQNILRAAERQFSHYGFSKVTMKEIAAEIGMGKASLYYYFATKEELFRSVLTAKHETFIAELERELAAKAPADRKVRTCVARRMDYFIEVTNLNIVDVENWHALRPVLRETYTNFAKREHAILRSVLGEGARHGDLAVAHPDRMAHTIIRIMQGLRCRFLRAIDHPRVEPKQYQALKKEVLFVTDLLLDGMRARPRRATAARRQPHAHS